MSNFSQALSELERYVKSGAVFVIIQTAERYRAERLMRRFLAQHSFTKAWYYTPIHQVLPLNPDEQLRESMKKKSRKRHLSPVASVSTTPSPVTQGIDVNSDPLTWMRKTFQQTTQSLVMLADSHPVDHDTLFARELLETIYLAKETSNTIVLITSGSVWSALTHFGFVIDLDFPDELERRELIDTFLRDTVSSEHTVDKAYVDEFVAITGGLSEIQLENLLREYVWSSRNTTNDYGFGDVIAGKEALFPLPPAITRVKYDDSMPIAGLSNLRAWLARKKSVFFASQAQLRERHLQAPKGALLMGVPGCGKSFSAKVLAREWSLPLYRLDFSAIYNKYVGETERLMRETLAYLDNVSPCIVWIDEIEKVMASQESNSDVDRRVLAQFLFWLQESTSRVFLIATANNPASLPNELMRRGRFSEIFFINLPNAEERREALTLYASQSLHTDYAPDELSAAVAHSSGFSFSDIHHIIRDIAEQVEFEGRPIPGADELADIFAQSSPSGVSDHSVSAIRQWATEHSAIPASGQGE